MFCKYCGAPVYNDAKYCTSCGAAVESGTPAEGIQTPPQFDGQPQQIRYVYITPPLPMKWFKFLIYFSLWAGAVLSVIEAILIITGTMYDISGGSGASELVYSSFPALKPINIIYGAVCLLYAAFLIYVRFRLAGFKKNGPKLLYISYLLAIVTNAAYLITNLIVIGENVASSRIIISFISDIVVLILNCIYFEKRKHLFVN